MIILEKPYTLDELNNKKDINNYVEGIIKVKLNDIKGKSLDDYLDMISEMLTGSCLLRGIEDSVAGADVEHNSVLIKVRGDVLAIIDEEYEEFYGDDDDDDYDNEDEYEDDYEDYERNYFEDDDYY